MSLNNQEIEAKREVYRDIAKFRRVKGAIIQTLKNLEGSKTHVSRAFYDEQRQHLTELLILAEKELIKAELQK